MNRKIKSVVLAKRLLSAATLALALLSVTSVVEAEQQWDHYGGSEKGQQYSSAEQIKLSNVASLREVWRYRTGEMGEGSEDGYSFQATPILVNDTLYISTGSAIVIALDPTSGVEKWRFDPKLDRTKGTAETANRGVSSWRDPNRTATDECFHRIYVGTLDARMISLDGNTGMPCSDFGNHGEVDLSTDVRLTESESYEYSVTSPPVIVGDVLITGSAIGDNRAVELELGIVRGLDARSGKTLWRFDPIPRSAENPMYSSWNPDEAKRNGAANAWAPLAADSDLGLVYVPTGSASPDFYGGERQGDNRYANSLVALDTGTGKVIWHQQLVHHDVWDYDLPAQPTLVELDHGGKKIPAVIQATKMGMLFTFNRVTGEPIFAVEEKPVPQGGVAGEHLSPTQPFPIAPPPLIRHTPVTADDAFGMLLFDKWACADKFESYRSEGIYTPPSLQGTIEMPSYAGGMNWGGIAFDPVHQIAVANTIEIAAVVQLIKRDELVAAYKSGDFPDSEFSRQSGTPYGMRREIIMSPLGVPCSQPPWGRLSAVDMRNGEILWQVAFGSIEDIAPAMVPNLELGVPGIGGPIITASGLIFIAAAADDYLRGFNLLSGKEIWKARLPAGGQATPMTYTINGKQYIVIAAGGHQGLGTTLGDYVVAFSLPDSD